jgi:hypothetical protein
LSQKFDKVFKEERKMCELRWRKLMKFSLVSFLLVFALVSVGGLAMIETLTLDQMVKGSEIIVLAEVEGVKEVGKTPEGIGVVANLLNVKSSMKGNCKVGEKIKVKTYSQIEDAAQFKKGETFVVFLNQKDKHMEVFNGVQGVWPVDADGKIGGMGTGKTLDQVKDAASVQIHLSQPKVPNITF